MHFSNILDCCKRCSQLRFFPVYCYTCNYLVVWTFVFFVNNKVRTSIETTWPLMLLAVYSASWIRYQCSYGSVYDRLVSAPLWPLPPWRTASPPVRAPNSAVYLPALTRRSRLGSTPLSNGRGPASHRRRTVRLIIARTPSYSETRWRTDSSEKKKKISAWTARSFARELILFAALWASESWAQLRHNIVMVTDGRLN